ncbi:tRNA (cytidine(34)-2'-O)-methyltransferase [Candidatus Norongarragalina meridionalis]|nr:tRNA (cytidine(34)-2'-O)-methyltransferase [Candidatus Norongarragalina meridionalis]
MRISVVLVRPMHEINVGSAARAMLNFGLRDMRMVQPEAKLGFQTKMFAKHAWDIARKAKKFETLAAAVKDCDVVVGTTGVTRRFRINQFKYCVTAAELRERLGKAEKVALVFGNEGSGLDEKEMAACDLVAHVPTKGKQGVMNLSHAVAVMLYELCAKKAPLYKPASKQKRKALELLFSRIVSRKERIRDKKKVALAFKRVIERARVTDDEAQALLAAFGE